MHVLADLGMEFGKHEGLGWLPGIVDKLEVGRLPLPHIGWNDVEIETPNSLINQSIGDLNFYFLHSYVFRSKDSSQVIATTEYGQRFPSIVRRENIFGVQFHPEKSQFSGKTLLDNFTKL